MDVVWRENFSMLFGVVFCKSNIFNEILNSSNFNYCKLLQNNRGLKKTLSEKIHRKILLLKQRINPKLPIKRRPCTINTSDRPHQTKIAQVPNKVRHRVETMRAKYPHDVDRFALKGPSSRAGVRKDLHPFRSWLSHYQNRHNSTINIYTCVHSGKLSCPMTETVADLVIKANRRGIKFSFTWRERIIDMFNKNKSLKIQQ